MQDIAPLWQGLVGRENDRLPLQVASVDDVVKDIGSVISER